MLLTICIHGYTNNLTILDIFKYLFFLLGKKYFCNFIENKI